MRPDISHFSAALRADTDIMSSVARTADLTTSVAACPGWDLRRLIEHTGSVQRWATYAITSGAQPPTDISFRIGPDDNLAVWIVDGATALIESLDGADPDDDTWHPFPLEQKVWVWARRQAAETAMHRWDAQTAAGITAHLDPELASSAIGEYLEMGLPRVLERTDSAPPTASLHVHCTDVDGEWLVWNDGGAYRMLPVHDKGDAALRGTAADLWLTLMRRLDRAEVDIVGDPAAADAWLDLPAW